MSQVTKNPPKFFLSLKRIFFFLIDLNIKLVCILCLSALQQNQETWKCQFSGSRKNRKLCPVQGLNMGPWVPCLAQGSPDSHYWKTLFPSTFHIQPKTICKVRIYCFHLENCDFLKWKYYFLLEKKYFERKLQIRPNKNAFQKHPSSNGSLKPMLCSEAVHTHHFWPHLGKQGLFNLHQLKVLFLIRDESISPSWNISLWAINFQRQLSAAGENLGCSAHHLKYHSTIRLYFF